MTTGTTAGLIGTALIAGLVLAQAPPTLPAFEVASIRPVTPGGGRGRGGPVPGRPQIGGGRVDLPFIPLGALFPYAFQVKDYQVVMPAWVHQSIWAISARLPIGASQDQAPDMMQALLIERFKLTFHREKRERPVSTLTVAEGGSKLQAASPDDFPVWDGSFPAFSFRGPLQAAGTIAGRISPGKDCARRFDFVPLPMAGLADFLARFVDRPVMDQTGMQGTYKVTLDIPAEAEAVMVSRTIRAQGLTPRSAADGGGRGGRGGAAGPGNLAPSPCPDPITLIAEGVGPADAAMIKAVQPLGLRLQQSKAMIETIVVDRLEKTPTEN